MTERKMDIGLIKARNRVKRIHLGGSLTTWFFRSIPCSIPSRTSFLHGGQISDLNRFASLATLIIARSLKRDVFLRS